MRMHHCCIFYCRFYLSAYKKIDFIFPIHEASVREAIHEISALVYLKYNYNIIIRILINSNYFIRFFIFYF